MKTEIKNLEINEAGTYVVDRINDRLDNNQHHVLDVNDLQSALELFDNDGHAYSLRFVPDGIHPYGYKGRLVTHKNAPFPENLTIAESIIDWVNKIDCRLESTTEEEPLHHQSVDAMIYCFNEYYAYHPELHTKWREIVLLYLRLVQAFGPNPTSKGIPSLTDLLRLACRYLLDEYVEYSETGCYIDPDKRDWFRTDIPFAAEELVPEQVHQIHNAVFGDTGLLNLTDVADREAWAQHNSQKQP